MIKAETYIPTDALKPYINSFAIYESDEEHNYTILPGTVIVIGFQYKGRLSLVNDQLETSLSVSGVTGLHDQHRLFKNTTGTGSVIVYFKEMGATPFFRHPLHELFRESVSLDNFMLRSELLLLEEQLQEAATSTEKIKVTEHFFLTRMNQVEPDALVAAAVSMIHASKGNIRMTDLADQLHTSASPLEKRFRKSVGCSLKKFASIVRMKHAIHIYAAGNSLTALGYEAGFYDQSHFIKEFKTFTGQTPEDFFTADQSPT